MPVDTLSHLTSPSVPSSEGSQRRWRSSVEHVGPNWYASVMGTGIVATAAATLPLVSAQLRLFAEVVWVVAVVLLVGVTAVVVAHWRLHPQNARSHHADSTMAQFYGAPPMALMTVGVGAILIGRSIIGLDAAVALDSVLWTVGTLGGLVTAVWVPYLVFTRHEVNPDAAFGGWLMPVVPPMVSAATGALLVPHVAEGAARTTLLYGCYAMFGLSLLASLIVITMIWSRLAHHGTSGSPRVPTLWIVLGPLGQSITAAGLLGTNAKLAVEPQLAAAMNVFAIFYGVPVWGFATLWIALATLLTVRTVRRGLPFALTWWSFTFPVGTFVTGATQLAVHTGLPAYRWAAVLAYAGLLAAFGLVAARTARGGLRGELTRRPAAADPVVAVKG